MCGEQLQQMRNVATRQNVETTKSKDDNNGLRTTITELRDKINETAVQVKSAAYVAFHAVCVHLQTTAVLECYLLLLFRLIA